MKGSHTCKITTQPVTTRLLSIRGKPTHTEFNTVPFRASRLSESVEKTRNLFMFLIMDEKRAYGREDLKLY